MFNFFKRNNREIEMVEDYTVSFKIFNKKKLINLLKTKRLYAHSRQYNQPHSIYYIPKEDKFCFVYNAYVKKDRYTFEELKEKIDNPFWKLEII